MSITSIKHWFKPVDKVDTKIHSECLSLACENKSLDNKMDKCNDIDKILVVKNDMVLSSNINIVSITNDDLLKESDKEHEMTNKTDSLKNFEKSAGGNRGTMNTIKSIRIEAITSYEDLEKECVKLNLTLNPDPCHMDELKKLREKDDEVNEHEEGEYEVEEIVKCRRNNGALEYRVKWKGWSSHYNTWERLTNLGNCLDIVEKYHLTNNIDPSGNKRKRETVDDIKAAKKSRIGNLISDLAQRKDYGSLLRLRGLTASTYQSQNFTKLVKETKQILKSKPLKKGSTLEQLISTKNGLFDEFLSFVEKRKETLSSLQKWEDDINKLLNNSAKIKIENHVDLEVFPDNFTYITDYRAAQGIIIPDDPPVGCECTNCYDERKSCCASQSGNYFAYTRFGTLNVEPGSPIYECNRRCKCGPDCLNRIVQKGRQIELSIYRTDNGCGWGVKTLEKIKKGTFVMEYVGEVISNEEADKRGKIYDASGRTYLFDLDYDDSDCLYTVDAAFYGNVAHFMNHSCDPNLVVYGVWINNLDPKLPRLAFFARRDIKKGEELNFDYTMSTSCKGNESPRSPKTQDESKNKLSIECKCGSENCKGYVF